MHEKYMDALYRFQEMLGEDFAAFVEETEKRGLTEGRICYADMVMHLAKNLRKEQFAEEGMSQEEIEGVTGGTQAYGRAIRTTPGLTGEQSGNGQSGYGRSMRSGARGGQNSGRSAYSGEGNASGRRDSRGRFASSGAEDEMFSEMQKMADMTTNHDEREIIMNMIERLKRKSEQ